MNDSTSRNALPRLTRRRALAWGGAAGVAGLAAAGGAWFANERQRVDYALPAYAGWKQALDVPPEDAGRFAAFCGSLAASAHNTQPWRFHVEAARIDILADAGRTLGSADPKRHLMLMSLGAAAENVRIAASHLGLAPRIEWRLDDGPIDSLRPCASVHLAPGGPRGAEPNFEAIFTRRTNRGPYDLQAAPAAQDLEEIRRAAAFAGAGLDWYASDSPQGREIALYTVHGVQQWLRDDTRHRDGMRWWRVDRADLQSRRDGLSIHTTDAPALVKQGMDLLVDRSMWSGDFGKSGERMSVENSVQATPVWGLVTARPGAAGVLQAGALLERVYLEAARRGYAVQPLCYSTELQLLQTYSAPVLKLDAGVAPVMALRFGRPLVQVEQSVRRDFAGTLV